MTHFDLVRLSLANLNERNVRISRRPSVTAYNANPTAGMLERSTGRAPGAKSPARHEGHQPNIATRPALPLRAKREFVNICINRPNTVSMRCRLQRGDCAIGNPNNEVARMRKT